MYSLDNMPLPNCSFIY